MKTKTDWVTLADDLYRRRGDLNSVRELIELLEERMANASSYELSWRLARALFFVGQETTATEDAKDYFRRGTEAGKLAVAQDPNAVAGHFWFGVNLALLAENEAVWVAVPHVLKAKRALKQAASIDQSFHDAGALRVLGRLQHKLPRVFGGSNHKARELYQRACALAPNNSVTRIFLAELLLDLKNHAAAREQLELVLKLPLDSYWDFEIERDKRRAADLLHFIRENS